MICDGCPVPGGCGPAGCEQERAYYEAQEAEYAAQMAAEEAAWLEEQEAAWLAEQEESEAALSAAERGIGG